MTPHGRPRHKKMGSQYSILYPRRRIPRALVRLLGRLVLPLAFRIEISGRENFPRTGPLLVAGNHSAAMEAVLMVVYTPWQIEMLGAADIPHETITQIAGHIYGLIPVNRGHFDRAALTQSLDVLRQGGVVAVFPEGGIWDAGRMQAHTGVAWLSYRANVPVLPIGFGGTIGALGAALQLKRPRLTMRVGKMLPAAHLADGKPRKACFQAFVAQVVEAIQALLPADDPAHREEVADERFELHVEVRASDGSRKTCPKDLEIEHGTALAKLLHSPAILKIFTSNLKLPTRPLQNLDREPDPAEIVEGTQAILDYLHEDNPHLLEYRLGVRQAKDMQLGLHELLALARWASESNLRLILKPIRRYLSCDAGEEIMQVRQGSFKDWM